MSTFEARHPAPVQQPATAAARPRLTARAFASAAGVVAASCLAFEVAHTFEHVVQVAAWFADPAAPAAMTPWGMALADAMTSALARVTTPVPGAGMELLHLVGNTVFLLGLLALHPVFAAAGLPRRGWLRAAVVLQGLHVVEHLALTLTLQLGGTALGLSTLGGALQAGTPVATTTRVWFHFVVNGVAALLCLAALLQARLERQQWRETREWALQGVAAVCVALALVAVVRGGWVLMGPAATTAGEQEAATLDAGGAVDVGGAVGGAGR